MLCSNLQAAQKVSNVLDPKEVSSSKACNDSHAGFQEMVIHQCKLGCPPARPVQVNLPGEVRRDCLLLSPADCLQLLVEDGHLPQHAQHRGGTYRDSSHVPGDQRSPKSAAWLLWLPRPPFLLDSIIWLARVSKHIQDLDIKRRVKI